jgi:cytochrome c biogenesis protein ResB
MASSDPTFPLALGAAALMLLGMLISLWIPQRRLWLQVAEGTGQMVGGSEFEGDFEPLGSEIAKRLGHRQASQESETNG